MPILMTANESGMKSVIVCLCVYVPEFQVASMFLSLLAKAFISLAYAVVYLYGSEVFPTEIRNIGMGIASLLEGLGWLLAPSAGGYLV